MAPATLPLYEESTGIAKISNPSGPINIHLTPLQTVALALSVVVAPLILVFFYLLLRNIIRKMTEARKVQKLAEKRRLAELVGGDLESQPGVANRDSSTVAVAVPQPSRENDKARPSREDDRPMTVREFYPPGTPLAPLKPASSKHVKAGADYVWTSQENVYDPEKNPYLAARRNPLQ